MLVAKHQRNTKTKTNNNNRNSNNCPCSWRLSLLISCLLYAGQVQAIGGAQSSTASTAALLTGQQLAPWQTTAAFATHTAAAAATAAPTARNLYAPYQTFSQQDDVSFKDVRQRNDGSLVQSFGSYRTARQSNAGSAATAQRRSDVEIIPAPSVELPQSELITIPKQLVPTLPENVTRQGRRRNYMYIPLQTEGEASSPASLLQLRPSRNATLSALGPPPEGIAAVAHEFGAELAAQAAEQQQSQTVRTERSDLVAAASTTDKLEYAEPEQTSRRVGFQFPSYSLKPANPFYPQGYREDSPIFEESSGAVGGAGGSLPFTEDATPTQYDHETRHTRQLYFDSDVSPSSFEFPGLVANSKPHTLNAAVAAGKIYRDDVTKFGDINGPITALPGRLQRGLYFGDTEFRTGPSPMRQFGPQKAFNEYVAPGDYQSSRKSRYFPYKSSRSPRVVFPSNDNVGTTGPSGSSAPSGTGVYFSDNIAFR